MNPNAKTYSGARSGDRFDHNGCYMGNVDEGDYFDPADPDCEQESYPISPEEKIVRFRELPVGAFFKPMDREDVFVKTGRKAHYRICADNGRWQVTLVSFVRVSTREAAIEQLERWQKDDSNKLAARKKQFAKWLNARS